MHLNSKVINNILPNVASTHYSSHRLLSFFLCNIAQIFGRNLTFIVVSDDMVYYIKKQYNSYEEDIGVSKISKTSINKDYNGSDVNAGFWM